MAEQLNGKVVLVTGAGSSIGRAVALAEAREGARVVVSDVTVERGEETVRIIGGAGGEAVFVGADVSSAKEVEALVGGAVESYGRLDCAVNTAGIEGALPPLTTRTRGGTGLLAINLTGEFLCIKHEISRMLETGSGSIVNMASVLGLVGFADAPAYTAGPPRGYGPCAERRATGERWAASSGTQRWPTSSRATRKNRQPTTVGV